MRAVLILDEPTAALDARAEFEVFQRFKALSAGRTAVLISHRFTSVRMADRILVLAGGRVEAAGTHAELLAAGRAVCGAVRVAGGGISVVGFNGCFSFRSSGSACFPAMPHVVSIFLRGIGPPSDC